MRKATVAQPRKTAVLECRIQTTSHRKQRKKYAKKGLDPFAFCHAYCAALRMQRYGTATGDGKPKIRIGGTTYAPYFYRNIGGHYTGIDVEIAEEACARIGYEPIFVELDIDKGFELLDEDYVDCLWCCLTMEGKEDKFIWAGPYMYTQRVVVVPADSEIETLEDLAGKCVAVQAGSISEEIILKGLNPNLPEITDLSTFSTMGEVFTSLRKGYTDAAIGHESSLRLYTDEYPDGYRYLNMNMYSDAVGVAFKPDGDAVLAEKLTQTLLEMREDGTMAAIVKKYGLDAEKNVNGGTE